MKRARQAHEQPRPPEDIARDALKLARLALVLFLVLALFCAGADLKEALSAAALAQVHGP